MNKNTLRVLLAGESWISYGIHIKGFTAYTTGAYEEGFEPLARAMDDFAEFVHMPNHLANIKFPDTVEELSKYDVILFSDIPADTLLLHPDTLVHSIVRPNRLRVIQEYVSRGGGFGMIGGYMSFAGFEGKARYRKSPVAEMLPVIIDSVDDRVEMPEGLCPRILEPDHPILKSIPDEWPTLLGYNCFAKKPDAQELMRFDNDPFLVVGTYGKGRTLAYASDCSPHWGSPEFVGWQYYKTFWQQLVNWLAGRS